MHVLRTQIMPHELFLKKEQLVQRIRERTIETFPTLPKSHINYVSYVLAENHYRCVGIHTFYSILKAHHRFYMLVRTSMRYDIRKSMSKLENNLLGYKKPRGPGVRGRDLLQWFQDTHEAATVLDKLVKGVEEVTGFRRALFRKWQGQH